MEKGQQTTWKMVNKKLKMIMKRREVERQKKEKKAKLPAYYR